MILWVVFFYLQDFLHTNIHVRVLLKHLHLIKEMNYNRKNKNIPYSLMRQSTHFQFQQHNI